MQLIDHTDENWRRRYRSINGAYTYSQDLVRYQVPRWREVLGGRDILSTCPRFSDVAEAGDRRLALQYLHSYHYYRPVESILDLKARIPFRYERLIFLTAYEAFERELTMAGLEAVYVPMSIDVEEVRRHQLPRREERRILWFGNITMKKKGVFRAAREAAHRANLQFDWISHERFNGVRRVTQEEALAIASQYRYGIAVGRCALELLALGVKTVIAGQRFGGLMTNNSELGRQRATNMNGRIVTFSAHWDECLANIEQSITISTDIRLLDHAEMVRSKYGDLGST